MFSFPQVSGPSLKTKKQPVYHINYKQHTYQRLSTPDIFEYAKLPPNANFGESVTAVVNGEHKAATYLGGSGNPDRPFVYGPGSLAIKPPQKQEPPKKQAQRFIPSSASSESEESQTSDSEFSHGSDSDYRPESDLAQSSDSEPEEEPRLKKRVVATRTQRPVKKQKRL